MLRPHAIMAAKPARPIFSVIIPLEFHRGMAGRCLAGWCQSQDFPREHFEVILALPLGHAVPELEEARRMLADWDQVVTLPVCHDMELVAATAGHARGELLVFTEAHCIPEPDFLTAAMKVMERHPEWSGFSGSSKPVTHNPLSEVEASMYSAAIRQNVEQHPWLKVLDQCLVLRRSAYFQCGGIEAEYGHFAEWLLSARLHRHNLQLGFDPSAAVSHYYIGEFEDITIFTQDFARGHMKFAMQCAGDPCATLLASPACWEDRAGYERTVAWHMVGLLWRARKAVPPGTERVRWRARLAMWLRRATGGLTLECREAHKRIALLRRRTEGDLGRADRAQAQASFLELILACGVAGQLSALRDAPAAALREFVDRMPPSKRSGQWLPGSPGGAIQAGFHARGAIDDRSFCWTQPEAMVWLPLKRGRHVVRVRWVEFSQLPGRGRYRFYHDERDIPHCQIKDVDKGVEIILEVRGGRGARLGWTCAAHHGPEEFRDLGMPLAAIKWQPAAKHKASPSMDQTNSSPAPLSTLS